MTSTQVNFMGKKTEPPQRTNDIVHVTGNDELPSISDPEEMPVIEDSMDEYSALEITNPVTSSPEESISSSLGIPTAYTKSMKPSKPIGRLQRWKYCLIGERIIDTSEKNTYLGCPINTGDKERQVPEPFLMRNLFGDYADTEIDLSDVEEPNPKISSQSCNLIFSLGKEEWSKSGPRSMSTDFNVTTDQLDKDLKDKLDFLKDSLNDDEPYDCRICHGGPSSGMLVSPCYCIGTMGQMHAACLEQWLGSNGRKDCELCGYHYHLYREPRSFREFLNNPGTPHLARHLKCDVFCFAVLTPTTMISVCLLLFAASLLEWHMTWSVVGLISTSVFLVMIYVFWSIMAFTYQNNIWQKWKLTNQVVRLKCTSKCDWDYQDSHPATTASEPSLLGEATLLQLPPSTLTVNSTGAISELDTESLDIDFPGPEASVSEYISLEPSRFSPSFTDVRMVLPSSTSSSSICTSSSEPSLVVDTGLFESSSHKRVPKTV